MKYGTFYFKSRKSKYPSSKYQLNGECKKDIRAINYLPSDKRKIVDDEIHALLNEINSDLMTILMSLEDKNIDLKSLRFSIDYNTKD
jgi:hypothetical protein